MIPLLALTFHLAWNSIPSASYTLNRQDGLMLVCGTSTCVTVCPTPGIINAYWVTPWIAGKPVGQSNLLVIGPKPCITSVSCSRNPGGYALNLTANAAPGQYAVEIASRPQGPWTVSSTVPATGGTLAASTKMMQPSGFVELEASGT